MFRKAVLLILVLRHEASPSEPSDYLKRIYNLYEKDQSIFNAGDGLALKSVVNDAFVNSKRNVKKNNGFEPLNENGDDQKIEDRKQNFHELEIRQISNLRTFSKIKTGKSKTLDEIGRSDQNGRKVGWNAKDKADCYGRRRTTQPPSTTTATTTTTRATTEEPDDDSLNTSQRLSSRRRHRRHRHRHGSQEWSQ